MGGFSEGIKTRPLAKMVAAQSCDQQHLTTRSAYPSKQNHFHYGAGFHVTQPFFSQLWILQVILLVSWFSVFLSRGLSENWPVTFLFFTFVIPIARGWKVCCCSSYFGQEAVFIADKR